MAETPPVVVGGLTPFSTIDYPGHLAAVIFCQGCPWRCAYCHNPQLRPPEPASGEKRWTEIVEWLESRRGLLDAVVFSGGEPLLQRRLSEALRQVRALGYGIGLHTAGICPRRLSDALPLIDWLGLDIKAPFRDYARVTGGDNGSAARRSLALALASGKPYEIRCTVDESLLAPDDARRMVRQLARMGVWRITLQTARAADGTARPISRAFIDAAEKEIECVELR
jgi:pyruvate formate lyase activating enzyme